MEVGQIERSRNGIVRKLVAGLDARCPGAAAHSAQVAVYAVATAAELIGDDDLLSIRYAAELHDLGKRSSEARERSDPDRAAEQMAEHPFLAASALMVRHHQEWWNGSGYPDGLAGRRIPLGSRIIALAEAFDLMTMAWNQGQRISEGEALQEIGNQAGRQFDPAVVRAFLRVQPVIQPVGL